MDQDLSLDKLPTKRALDIKCCVKEMPLNSTLILRMRYLQEGTISGITIFNAIYSYWKTHSARDVSS